MACYKETGSVKYYQILIAKQLVSEVLRGRHGEFGNHLGITKTKTTHTRNNYHPKKAQLIRKCVMSCKQCVRESTITDKLTVHHHKNHVNMSPDLNLPCRFIWFRKYLCQVAIKTLLQPRTCSLENCLRYLQRNKTPKQMPES